MGHRDASDPRNTLIGEFARIVLDVRPKAFVMENVPAMVSGGTHHLLEQVIGQLEAGGYRITKPLRTLTASYFGVPQVRTRLFVLGVRDDLSGQIPYPTGPCEGQPSRPTVLEAIGDLPNVESDDTLFHNDRAPYEKDPVGPYSKVARGLLSDPSDLSVPRVWNRKRCTGCLRTAHNPKSVELYRATPPGGSVPGHKLPRLDPNGLAPTLRAGSDSTRGSYTAPRPIHPILPRCITAREAARLHGYPDWFSFFPTKWHGYKQIGNSVAPPVGRAIGQKVLGVLGVEWTTRPPAAVELTDDFDLPENRPRQLARIPQVREYPPVITRLFTNKFDPRERLLRESKFSFDDVRLAIEASGANLAWTREETFLDEVARSRNVARLLATPLNHGYTIRKLGAPPWIGEFVPVGTAGSIDEKDGTTVRVRDLSDALAVPWPRGSVQELSASAGLLLNQTAIRTTLWGRRVREVSVVKKGSAAGSSIVQRIRIQGAAASCRFAVALVSTPENVPNKSRIGRVAASNRVSEVIAVTAITSHHLLITRHEISGTGPKELARRVFRLEDPSGSTVVQEPPRSAAVQELLLFPDDHQFIQSTSTRV